MEFTFENRRILVTGAGRGIGRELSKHLATQGKATVIALAKTEAHLNSLKAECPSIQTVCVDLANWDETKAAIEPLLPIHGLVNNAAVIAPAPFLEITPEQFDLLYTVNVKSVINISQIVARGMKASGKGGSIVNVSSLSSLIAARNMCVYGSSKSALNMVTKVMAKELGEFNIRVNAVHPTVVTAGMGENLRHVPEFTKRVLELIPMHKFPDACDVIHPILFLLSEKSNMINGIMLPVDGGQMDLLPEIIDPRLPRGMPLRQPPYRKIAIEHMESKKKASGGKVKLQKQEVAGSDGTCSTQLPEK